MRLSIVLHYPPQGADRDAARPAHAAADARAAGSALPADDHRLQQDCRNRRGSARGAPVAIAVWGALPRPIARCSRRAGGSTLRAWAGRSGRGAAPAWRRADCRRSTRLATTRRRSAGCRRAADLGPPGEPENPVLAAARAAVATRGGRRRRGASPGSGAALGRERGAGACRSTSTRCAASRRSRERPGRRRPRPRARAASSRERQRERGLPAGFAAAPSTVSAATPRAADAARRPAPRHAAALHADHRCRCSAASTPRST